MRRGRDGTKTKWCDAVVAALGWASLGCGGKYDLGNGTMPEQTDSAQSPGGSGTEIVRGETNTEAVVSDGTRLYFVVQRSQGGGSSGRSLESCEPSDCARTLALHRGADGGWLDTMTVDGANLYWSGTQDGSNPRYFACPKSSCESGSVRQLMSSPTSMVVSDGISLYWFGEQTILRCPVGGCEQPELVAVLDGYPVDLALDDSSIYVVALATASLQASEPRSGRVMALAKSGTGGPRILADDQVEPNSIAANREYVVWVASDGVKACRISGCGEKPMLIAEQSQPFDGSYNSSLLVDDRNAYWAQAEDVFACSLVGCGTTPKQLGTGRVRRWDELTMDADFVYWIHNRNELSSPPSGVDLPSDVIRARK